MFFTCVRQASLPSGAERENGKKREEEFNGMGKMRCDTECRLGEIP